MNDWFLYLASPQQGDLRLSGPPSGGGDEFATEGSLPICYLLCHRCPRRWAKKVSLKDFSNEVRAYRDVTSYLRNMSLLLDMPQTSVDDIIEACLASMLEGSANSRTYDQAKELISQIFNSTVDVRSEKKYWLVLTKDGTGTFGLPDNGAIPPTRAKLAPFLNIHQLSRTLQCTSISEGGGFDYDQNWICAMCSVPSLTSRKVCIARLLHSANLGQTCQEVHFIIVILVPTKEKGTKSELEVARTFGTIFSDMQHRQELIAARTEDDFKDTFGRITHELASRHGKAETKVELAVGETSQKVRCGFLRGVAGDLRRRLPHYLADYKDGLADRKSILKTISCTFFLYFACILPSIAFGVLNSDNTEGILTVEKVLYSQVFGGLVFAIVGGTPQIVLLTTAPLAIYTQIIFSLSDRFDLDFQAFFACVGLFNCFFLVIFSVFDLSVLMQYSTRSSEEIFALFISIAFSVDAFKNCAKNFDHHYCDPKPHNSSASNLASAAVNNLTSGLLSNGTEDKEYECAREISLLYLLLLLGTLWLGVTLFTFKDTPYLTAGKRELLADYALPVAVIAMAFIGAFCFKDVDVGKSFETSSSTNIFKWVDMSSLGWEAILGAAGLGFCLSLLFFMDQNISAALVNAPQNKMQKGTAYHWDLLVIAAINAVLSLLCFPWVHAALPHSPLHVTALADVEERVDQGHIYQIVVKVRETRVTGIFSHILIGLSLLITSVLAYIPTPVLYGLFLYVAVTALFGNQMFERIQLFFTEQSAYPPNHYIRRVPQRKMHTFTGLQLLQLVVLCAVGFAPYPYLKMFFPVLIFALIPIRHKLIPHFVEQKYLKAMDGH
ncbi:sodium bicarbonate transporter-like protein 11 [Plakobranchus ocellatus]|uniref:Sodium bicarbonate transporter-like protein 11 n=1 Tax=Plakobranchus ocellatus TaxID=259542 RepID=A0AAV4BCE5_9GAST|nr:sodium bicarbonate transporter-like protein 11 [Plakobranchus ocellatus]